MASLFASLGVLLGLSWGPLGLSWGALGRSWDPLGRSWDALGTLLGPPWGRSWRSWGALGCILVLLGSLLVPSGCPRTRFRPFLEHSRMNFLMKPHSCNHPLSIPPLLRGGLCAAHGIRPSYSYYKYRMYNYYDNYCIQLNN